jgi:type VI protein secretion system component VasK
MGILWGLIVILLACVAIVTIYDVVHRRPGAGTMAAWIVLVLLLPVVGALAYWLLRRPTASEVDRATDAQRDAARRPAAAPSSRFRA